MDALMRKTKEKKAKWVKTTIPYLFRHTPTGGYYVRIRLGGKEAIRKALKTNEYEVAKNRLPGKLADLRAEAVPRAGEALATLWDALKVIRQREETNPALKPRSREAYVRVIVGMNPMQPDGVPAAPVAKLTVRDVEAWWANTAGRYAPAMANYRLLFFRRAWKSCVESGSVRVDLSKKIKRLKVPRTQLKVITKEQFAQLVELARANPCDGKLVAEWMEFVAYTGCRPEEAWQVQWEDIDRKRGTLVITGGENGTKNHEWRRIPILPALADLLERIEVRRGGATGRVLSVRMPRFVIRAACDVMKIDWMTRYDFRHLFATRCNEAGVDVATFAKWLGHKDGGALALRTYVHPGEDHERQSAAKVRF